MSDDEAPKLEVVPDAPQDGAPAPFNAVVILREVDAEGTITTPIVCQGDVKATEVQTILEVALQAWRRNLGLSD